jgi:hypothetical protein
VGAVVAAHSKKEPEAWFLGVVVKTLYKPNVTFVGHRRERVEEDEWHVGRPARAGERQAGRPGVAQGAGRCGSAGRPWQAGLSAGGGTVAKPLPAEKALARL